MSSFFTHLFLCCLWFCSSFAMEKPPVNLAASHLSYDHLQTLKEVWQANCNKSTLELFTCLKCVIDSIEEREKIGNKEYIYSFLRFLVSCENAQAAPVLELLQKEYFLTIEYMESRRAIKGNEVLILLKVVNFFPYFQVMLQIQLREGTRKKIVLREITRASLELLEQLLNKWYIFAHTQERPLTFDETCTQPYLERLMEALCTEIKLLKGGFDPEVVSNRSCNDLLKLASEWNLKPLTIALLYHALGEANFESLRNKLDPSLMKDLFQLALSLESLPSVLDWIGGIQNDKRYLNFIGDIKDTYTDYVAEHINKVYNDQNVARCFQEKESEETEEVKALLMKKLIHRYYYNKFSLNKTVLGGGSVTCCSKIQLPATAYTPGSSFCVGSADGILSFYDPAKNTLVPFPGGNSAGVYTVQQLKNLNFISGSADKTIRVWNKDTLREEHIFMGAHEVYCILIVDTDHILSGSRDGIINVWDLKTGECLQPLRGHEKGVLCLAQVTQKYIVSGSVDKTVRLWERETGKQLNRIVVEDAVRCLEVLDENTVAIGLNNGKIQLISFAREAVIKQWEGHHPKAVTSLGLLDKDYLVSSSLDSTIKIWNLTSHEYQKPVQSLSHASEVQCLCILDPYTILAGCKDGSICLWKCPSFTSLKDLLQDLKTRESKKSCCIQ